MSAMKWDERKALLAAAYIYEYLRKESRKMARAYVYVDGFNLYYGALKRTPYKWLDLGKFCQVMRQTTRSNPSSISRPASVPPVQ